MRRILFYSFCFFLAGFILVKPCNAQYTLEFSEDKSFANLVTQKPKDGKALLIFKTELDLTFDSNSENLTNPPRKNGMFILEVSSGPQAISVFYEDIPTYLNFGQLQAANSLPELNIGDIKCFKVSIKPELEYADVTDSELKRGNFTTPFGPNVSDALLVVRLFPNDLELVISENNNLISKLEKSGSTYNVFLKMPESKKFSNYDLTVKASGSDAINVTVPKLAPKSVKFYRVRQPLVEGNSLRNENQAATSITQINTKEVEKKPAAVEVDFRKNVIGNWAGSLGDDKTYLEFTAVDEIKKSVTGKVYANGVYMNFKGVIRYKTENDYQASLNIIKDDLITFGASLDLRYNSGVLNGLWIDDTGGVRDFSAVRSSSIVYDNSIEVRQKVNTLNNIATGTWYSVNANLYFDNLVIEKANIQQIVSISFVKNNQLLTQVKGKLLSKSGKVSLMSSDVQLYGISTLCTISLLFDDNTSTVTIISDDGSLAENFKMYKQGSKTNVNAAGINDIYYVLKDKAYFYNTPELNSRTNKYIVKGQLPIVQMSLSNNYFMAAAYTYRGITTKGYLIKSDLAKFSLNYLLKSQWTGLFGNNQIKIVIETVSLDSDNNLVATGYNILKDQKRKVEGKIILIDENQIQINLAEPGTDEWDGVFKLTFSYNNDVSGVWLSNNGKLRREFLLKKHP